MSYLTSASFRTVVNNQGTVSTPLWRKTAGGALEPRDNANVFAFARKMIINAATDNPLRSLYNLVAPDELTDKVGDGDPLQLSTDVTATGGELVANGINTEITGANIISGNAFAVFARIRITSVATLNIDLFSLNNADTYFRIRRNTTNIEFVIKDDDPERVFTITDTSALINDTYMIYWFIRDNENVRVIIGDLVDETYSINNADAEYDVSAFGPNSGEILNGRISTIGSVTEALDDNKIADIEDRISTDPDTGVFVVPYDAEFKRNISMAGNKVTNLAEPEQVQDAVTKSYIDTNFGERFIGFKIDNSGTSYTVLQAFNIDAANYSIATNGDDCAITFSNEADFLDSNTMLNVTGTNAAQNIGVTLTSANVVTVTTTSTEAFFLSIRRFG